MPTCRAVFGNRAENAPGSVVCACMEGNRPIMVEVQALVAKTPYGMPRRTAVGFDYNRVNMLLAILERRLGMDFGNFDAYLNVVGGMKITEPSADLAAAAALVSSYRNKPVPHGVLAVVKWGLPAKYAALPVRSGAYAMLQTLALQNL